MLLRSAKATRSGNGSGAAIATWLFRMRYSGQKRRSHSIPARRLGLIVGGIALAVVAIASVVLLTHWPFSRAAVADRISRDTRASVTLERFHTTYFPPGFVAEGVQLSARRTRTPILTVQQFRVRASYSGLIHKQLNEIDVRGFHVIVGPANSFLPGSASEGSFGLSKLVAENGSIEIGSSQSGHQPFRIDIHQVVLTGLGGSHAKFQIAASDMRPPGEFRAEGEIDGMPWKTLGMAGISGRFHFNHADLGVFGGISGRLDASGRISGSIGKLQWDGTAIIPDFHVSGSAHRVRLESAYTVSIDTSDAAADLRQIRVSFNRTTALAQGRVARDHGDGAKTLQLAVRVDQGRLDDLLLLFSGEPRPRMTGSVRLNANVALPSGPPEFLRRLRLDGNFEIGDALFTNPLTQSSLNHLSESADGEEKPKEHDDGRQIPGLVRGAVKDSDGVARLSDIRYSSPGVNATLGGTFNMIDKDVRLQGVLATAGKLSDGTTGFKSVALRVARPFLPIRRHGKITTVPFTIRGSSSHPVLSLSTAAPPRSGMRLVRK
jgi:hypothetical protein